MKKLYIVWVFIIVLLLSTVTFFGFRIVNKNKEYKSKEQEMESIVAKYLGQYIEEYPSTGSKKIIIDDIINKGYNIDMSVENENCTGYVLVKKVSIAYEYDAFMKCDNYITDGYVD